MEPRVGTLVNPCRLSGRTPQSRRSGKRFLQSSELGLPHPTPLAAGECAFLPFGPGGAHSLAGEGLREYQFRRGDIHCGALYILVLCIALAHLSAGWSWSCSHRRTGSQPRLRVNKCCFVQCCESGSGPGAFLTPGSGFRDPGWVKN